MKTIEDIIEVIKPYWGETLVRFCVDAKGLTLERAPLFKDMNKNS